MERILSRPPVPRIGFALISVFLVMLFVPACSPPVQRPTGWAQVYQDSKEMFARANYDKSLEITDGFVSTAPAKNEATLKGRVLRLVILIGEVRGYKELAEAYDKGSKATKDARVRAEDERLRHDYRQYAGQFAIGIAEVSNKLRAGGNFPKEVTLDAPYPSVEGPAEIASLGRVMEGGALEAGDEDAAAHDAVRKGVDEALGDFVGGDRAKARNALTAGPVKLDGIDFQMFLARQLNLAATIFDAKHSRDPKNLRLVCGEADEVTKLSLDLLKDSPDKDKVKAVKKLQEQTKTTVKNI